MTQMTTTKLRALCVPLCALFMEKTASAADFPSYRQTFEATFASAEEAARAECAIAPLPGGAELAFGCRWDDSSNAHLAKAAMMGRAGVKGTFYVSASRRDGSASASRTGPGAPCAASALHRRFRPSGRAAARLRRPTSCPMATHGKPPLKWGATASSCAPT